MDTYPRFSVYERVKFEPDRRIAHRVSAARAHALEAEWQWGRRIVDAPRPRFRIKMAKWPTDRPVYLADRNRPAFRGAYRTVEDACRAMDNIIRRERNMPERINLPLAEIRAAMTGLDGRAERAKMRAVGVDMEALA